MEFPLRPLIILFLATWTGAGIALLFGSTDLRRAKLFLSFSGAFLFGIAITELFPELFMKGPQQVAYWVLAGFLLQLFLDFLSGGIEHGHVQSGKVPSKGPPYALLFGLSFHSFLESVPLGEGGALEGMQLLIGLGVHKIPVSLALAALLLNSGMKRSVLWIAFSSFSLTAPLGVLLGYIAPQLFADLPGHFSFYLLALVLGIILHVSTTILFESSEGHRLDGLKLIAVLAGFGLTIFL